jgi:hypothetical protein
MNTPLNIKKSVGTYGYKMCRREHHEICELARNRKLTLSGLIRGLLRQWRAEQKLEGRAAGAEPHDK